MSSNKILVDDASVVAYLTKLMNNEESKLTPEMLKTVANANANDEEKENIVEPKDDDGYSEKDSEYLESEGIDIDITFTNKEEFNQQMKEGLKQLREVGYRVYFGIKLEKEVNLNPKAVTDNDLNQVYDFKCASNLNNTASNLKMHNIMKKDISRCRIFPKYKSGSLDNPGSFRYLTESPNTLKILDRLWCLEVVKMCDKNKNLPNPDIFKTNLVRSFSNSCLLTAIENTLSIDNVALLDIQRAYDSFDWDITEELLLANLTRKVNREFAIKAVTEYMVILRNRKLYYNNIYVPVSKGIPTGLPSSQLVITLALDEIIYRFLQDNKNRYELLVDFKLLVYVDDFYLKIMKNARVKGLIIVNDLIAYLAKYKLYISMKKSRISKELIEYSNNEFTILTHNDLYLGIPFTRDIKLYGQIILKEFNKKHNNLLTWNDIYNILVNKTELYSKVLGYMNYKLKPFINDETDTTMIEFIDKHYLIKTSVFSTIFNWCSGLFNFK